MAVQIGWWGTQWLRYVAPLYPMDHFSDGQLKSAQRARADLSVQKGKIVAEVLVGTSGRTETATFKLKPLGERDWKKLLEAIALEPEAARRLLSGSVGPELETLARALGLSLFSEPTGREPWRCTCREWWGCRHLNALILQFASAVDANPFLWLEALGRPRSDLLAGLRSRLADHTPAAGESAAAGEAEAPVSLSAERFWETPVNPDGLRLALPEDGRPDALIRALGPLPVPLGEQIAEVLQEYVVTVGQGARAMAAGDLRLLAVPEKNPGKPLPLAPRLAEEAAAATDREGGLIGVDRLVELCPTAAALPLPDGIRAVHEAVQLLPADYMALAGRYVGPRQAVLAGARFRHVVSFADLRRGDMNFQADWVTALLLAGHEPPFAFTVEGHSGPPGSMFEILRPEIGDVIELKVIDPDRPLLRVALGRKSGDREQENRAAVRLLVDHMARTSSVYLREEDAVAVLLAERAAADEVWVLALRDESLQPGHGVGWRGITRQYMGWRPQFGRTPYGYWTGQSQALAWFSGALLRQAGSRQAVERALACVEWWCRHWVGPQDDPKRVPTIGGLLHFLWNVAPLGATPHRIDLEALPEALALWFEVLSERYPAVAGRYEEHIAACRMTEAYARRLSTAPRNRPVAEVLAWQAEGYAWIGVEHCLGSK